MNNELLEETDFSNKEFYTINGQSYLLDVEKGLHSFDKCNTVLREEAN